MAKASSILFVSGLLVFLSVGFAWADDVADLKEQIKILQETINAQQKTIDTLSNKIQSVESKQEAQATEIKNVPKLAQKIDEQEAQPKSMFEGTHVGGHLKFTLLDRTQGKRNGVDQHNNLSGGIYGMDNFFLFISKELTDWLKIDVVPQLDSTASATPAIGSNITRATSTSVTTRLYNAYMTVQLPKQYQLRAGLINAMYSEDYAKEIWWHELFNLPKGMCTLQSWHDSGAELYKNFDFDKWSLPVYLQALGGNSDRNIDNNENKMALLHVAPEFFHSNFRLLGSAAYGKWDTKDKENAIRNAVGFDWKYQKFNLRGEYFYWRKDAVVLRSTGTGPTADGLNKGYYIKGIYTLNPKWRAIVQQSYSNLYQAALTSTQNTMLSDKYLVYTLGLDFDVIPDSTIIAQYDHGNSHRSDGTESLKYDRITLGWRTTF